FGGEFDANVSFVGGRRQRIEGVDIGIAGPELALSSGQPLMNQDFPTFVGHVRLLDGAGRVVVWMLFPWLAS
ncbi:hypothetical protein, partial [Pseudomonas sp. MWU12-2115]|uniref:hypothetical protein n=1 Tax=Pseudomonas sp. MWU12-2115 TaxID=2071713 RepID=UPI001C49A869